MIITDSRGKGLQNDIDYIERKETDLNMQVFVWKGRGIVEAVKQTSKQLVWMAPSLILVFAGICDVTELNRETREISLADPTPDETISRYTGQMDIIRHHLSIMLTEKEYKLAFCEVIGADIGKYNRSNQEHPQQGQLDETILHLNVEIAAFNASNGMPTPWTAKQIHHNKKSRTKVSQYHKLSEDGLHFSEDLRMQVATTLYKYVLRFKTEKRSS